MQSTNASASDNGIIGPARIAGIAAFVSYDGCMCCSIHGPCTYLDNSNKASTHIVYDLHRWVAACEVIDYCNKKRQAGL